MKQKKVSFYEVNVRYFRDYSGNGIGDLTGLANKFEYFKYLGVEVLILQDILSVDSLIDKSKSFTKIASEIGDINNLARVIDIASKYQIKIMIELPVGSISENHKWFEFITKQTNSNFQDMITFFPKKDNEKLMYGFSQKTQQYFIKDPKTNEIPLNWKSENVLAKFVKVISFWQDVGVNGFVFKNYEYLTDIYHEEVMGIKTLKILRKFYRAIKEIDNNLIIIGRSNQIPLKDSPKYVANSTKVFDYFISEKIAENGIHRKYKQDLCGRFSIRKLVRDLKIFGKSDAHIITFDSTYGGRALSRWLNDGQYINEAAKTLLFLQYFNKASVSFYYGNEIGMPNIGLTHLDNFQDSTLEKRRALLKAKGINEKKFMDAQVSQNPINTRSLMAWDDTKNGGFSSSEQTISPVSNRYKEINVKFQFMHQDSVLNFSKKLLYLANQKVYQNIFAKGKFKIKKSHFFNKIIKLKIKYKKQSLVLIINLRNKPSFYGKMNKAQALLRNYQNEKAESSSYKLNPYETILFAKKIDEKHNVFTELAKTREIFLAREHGDQSRMRRLSSRLEKAEDKENERKRLVQDKQKSKIKVKSTKAKKPKVLNEEELRNQVANEIKAQIMEKNKKNITNKTTIQKPQQEEIIAKSVDQIIKEDKVQKPEIENKKVKDEIAQAKEEAKTQRDIDRSYLDEKTKLTEDEVAKTVLIGEDFEIDDLFDDED